MKQTNITIEETICPAENAYSFIAAEIGDDAYVLAETAEAAFLASLARLKEMNLLSCSSLRAFCEEGEVWMEKEPFISEFQVRVLKESATGEAVENRDISYLLRKTNAIKVPGLADGKGRLLYREYFAPDEDGFVRFKAGRLLGLKPSGGV